MIMDLNKLLTDLLSVVLNNEGANSPEDITDYVDSDTILDYMLTENGEFFSKFLAYLETSCSIGYYESDVKNLPYYKVLAAMITSKSYKEKCEQFMYRYRFDIELIKKHFR